MIQQAGGDTQVLSPETPRAFLRRPHIGGLPTGIRIAPKFKIVSTEQPVQVQMQQRQTQRTPRRSSPA